MKIWFALGLLAGILTSCEKNDEEITTGGGRLDKIVQFEGSDTTTIIFTYDGDNRTSGYRIISNGPGGTDSMFTSILRDNSGRVIQVTDIINSLPPTITNVTYDGGSAQLKSMISQSTYFRDSTHFVYSGNSIVAHYYQYNSSAATYNPGNRDEYMVLDGNIISTKNYDQTTGVLHYTETNTFDDKPTPAKRSIEDALVLNLWEPGYKNNITKTEAVSSGFTQSATITYDYTTSGQPASAQVTASPMGPSTIKYYYK